MSNKLYVKWCEIDLYVENSRSLKDKRRIVKSLKEKLKNHYNVAVCEYGDLSLWQRVQLAVVTCSNDYRVVDSTMKSILQFIDRTHSVSLLDYRFQTL
jgi:uncharacterized protein YlxP (DUF503 family)